MPTPEQHMDMCALSALATTFSEYDSPLLWSGLGSLVRSQEEIQSDPQLTLLGEVRLERPIPGLVLPLPSGLLCTSARNADHRFEACFIDPGSGSVATWDLGFRPFSVFRDKLRGHLWFVDAHARLLRGFDPKGLPIGTVAVPQPEHGSVALHPRYACCRENDILLGYNNGSHGVVSLGMADQGREPRFLLDGLPHMERVYWMSGLLLSLHFNPNVLMVHSLEGRRPPLRTVLLRGEPLTLARLDNGCILSTKEELVRLTPDLHVAWRVRVEYLKQWNLACPYLAEAGGDRIWIKDSDSNILLKVRV